MIYQLGAKLEILISEDKMKYVSMQKRKEQNDKRKKKLTCNSSQLFTVSLHIMELFDNFFIVNSKYLISPSQYR